MTWFGTLALDAGFDVVADARPDGGNEVTTLEEVDGFGNSPVVGVMVASDEIDGFGGRNDNAFVEPDASFVEANVGA